MSSSTSVAATIEPTGSTPKEPTIDIFNFGGCRYRTCWQYSPRGPAIDIFFNFGCRLYLTHWQHPQGAAIDVFFNFGGGRG
jgi:hypothetical protein